MNQITAAPFIPEPIMEIMLAMKMKRSPRWPRILRMKFQFSRLTEVQGPLVQGVVEKRGYNARVRKQWRLIAKG